MAKFTKKIVNRIVGLVKSDTYTIAEICQQVCITTKTFYKWMNDYPEFEEAVEEAKVERMQYFVAEAKKSLLRKVQGYTVDETKIVTVPGKEKDENGRPKPTIKEQTIIKKHIQPDTAAVIFTLTNGEPDTWRNRQLNEVTGKNGKDLFSQLTDDELNLRIKELERKAKL